VFDTGTYIMILYFKMGAPFDSGATQSILRAQSTIDAVGALIYAGKRAILTSSSSENSLKAHSVKALTLSL
jgi:hypothetical protein